MTPEEKLQFEEMQTRIKDLEENLNIRATDLIISSLIKRTTTVDYTDVNNALGSSGGPTFDFPDLWLEIMYQGTLYRLPAYLLSRF